MSSKTYLYRHFSGDGSLLYVGISLSWLMRTKAHSNVAEWFDNIAKVTIEQFPTREAALEAEREAIQRERPRHNVVHNRRVKTPLAPKKRRSLGPLGHIAGPAAIIGPALVYRENKVSVLVAWGAFGSPGELTEMVLGDYVPDVPDYRVASSVLVVRRMGEMTLDEARAMRMKVVRELASRLSKIEVFETDLDFAKAYARRFPSDESRLLLREVQGA